MQEEADGAMHVEAVQLLRHRHEVVVVNPYCATGPNQSSQGHGHHAVHFAVGRVVVVMGADEVGAGMQDRPQSGIGKTTIKLLVQVGREVDPGRGSGADRGQRGQRFLAVGVGLLDAGSDPGRSGGLDRLEQR